MPTGHIELSYDNAGAWKDLYTYAPEAISVVQWGPVRKLTKRVMYWGDAYIEGGGPNTLVRCSRDGGVTVYSEWDFGYVSGPRNSMVQMACCKLDPKHAYLVLDNGKVYKTIDYGENWTEVTPTDALFYGNNVKQMAVHPTNPDMVVIATYGDFWHSGFFWSTTGGTSWLEYHTTASYGDIPQRGTGATVTPDGVMLASCNYYTRVPESDPTRIYRLGDSPSTVFLGSAGSNGGWMDSAITGGTRVFTAGDYPNQHYGDLLSKTKGASFAEQYPSGLPEPGFSDGFTNCALSKSGMIAYVAIESRGLYRSKDNCATWEKLYAFVEVAAGEDYRVRGAIVSDPVNEDWVWMLAGENQSSGSNPKVIRFSENAGEDWEDVRSLVNPGSYFAFNSQFALGYDKNTVGLEDPVVVNPYG